MRSNRGTGSSSCWLCSRVCGGRTGCAAPPGHRSSCLYGSNRAIAVRAGLPGDLGPLPYQANCAHLGPCSTGPVCWTYSPWASTSVCRLPSCLSLRSSLRGDRRHGQSTCVQKAPNRRRQERRAAAIPPGAAQRAVSAPSRASALPWFGPGQPAPSPDLRLVRGPDY